MGNQKKETKRKLKAHYSEWATNIRLFHSGKEEAKKPHEVSIDFWDENDCFLEYSDQKYFATKSEALQFIKEFNDKNK